MLERQRLQVTAAIEPDLLDAPAHELRIRSAISAAKGPAVSLSLPRDRRPDKLARPRLVDGLELRAHMIALRIFEEDDRAFRRHEEIARRVAQEIAEHVARAGRIALVVGIEQQDRAIVRQPSSSCRKLLQALAAKLDRIDGRGLGIRQPHAVGGIIAHRMAHVRCRNRHHRPCRDRRRRYSW